MPITPPPENCPWCGSGRLRTRRAARRHRAAARAMLPFPEPESWLDVGTGHGHFPETAREIHPYTAFDGLDPTPLVHEARAAGRIEEAHHGHLTDPRILARLRARYDVVSMFRHLEHVPDPRAELRAALMLLRPEGHLLIEAPDGAAVPPAGDLRALGCLTVAVRRCGPPAARRVRIVASLAPSSP
ncbi:class I SAM-dependent methyltransferase [Streptomyces sp. NPDC048664]|uniref:class I SAM-dependent methyltransferase n=1 Tax=Streptomyces sp. NPDC048664 TaxID=3154505 RepID=UPI003414714B